MHAFALLTKQKIRFMSPRGPLSVEDLWDLPLTSTTGLSLDIISTTVLTEQDNVPRKSLVVKTSKEDKIVNAKIEVLKYIIQTKQEELEAKELAKTNSVKRQQILEALSELETGELKSKSKEELLKELEKLS